MALDCTALHLPTVAGWPASVLADPVQVLVTGASGFVGSRLGPALEAAGHEVRAMTRRPERYSGAGTPVAGDVGDEQEGQGGSGAHQRSVSIATGSMSA